MSDVEFEKYLKSIKVPEINMTNHKESLKMKLMRMQRVSLVTALLLIVAACYLGQSSMIFINIPSLVIILGLPLLLLGGTYGLNSITVFFRGFSNLRKSPNNWDYYIRVFQDMKKFFIFSGWMGLLIGFIQASTQIQNLSKLPVALSVASVTLLYGYIGAYCFCYPVQRKIEYELEKDES